MPFSMPIPPKPPWYFTPTAIALLPTAVPISCTSLLESPTDKSTANWNNKSYDNIENDRLGNNNNNNDKNDDADYFPQQDKQHVLTQDILPTTPTANNTSPSLIESPTDKPPMIAIPHVARTTPTTKQSAH